jgi:lysophospholipase L1-like esterase
MVRPQHFRAAGLLVLVLLAVACSALTPKAVQSSTPTDRPAAINVPILLIGDSIMVGARDFGALDGALAADGWTPEIVAENGKSVLWALDQVRLRATVPSVVLVEMGSNPGPGLDDFANDVTQLVSALTERGAKHIVWIPPEGRDPMRYAGKANVVAQAASTTVIVSKWPAELEANPQWFGDELHLTQDGYSALAMFVRDELRPLRG